MFVSKKIQLNKRKFFDSRGITLMETIFALAILVIGIIAVLTLASSSIVISQKSEQNIVVTNLAREGLEIVRGIREVATQGSFCMGSRQGDSRWPVCYVHDSYPAGNPAGDGVIDTNDNYYVLPSSVSNFFNVPDGCYTVGPDDAHFRLNQLTDIDCNQIFDCTACRLYQANGLYTHDAAGTPTPFWRMINWEKDEATGEVIILSRVAWTERGRTHTFVLEDHLTDWQ
jgi:Tfp pilus assembly protein PilV